MTNLEYFSSMQYPVQEWPNAAPDQFLMAPNSSCAMHDIVYSGNYPKRTKSFTEYFSSLHAKRKFFNNEIFANYGMFTLSHYGFLPTLIFPGI